LERRSFGRVRTPLDEPGASPSKLGGRAQALRTFDATLATIERRFIGSHQSMAIGRGPVMADIVSRRSSSSHQRLLWWPWIVTAFARLEGRIALDEVLSRFPEWEIDWEHAQQAHTSTVRGWEKLPVVTR